MDAERILETLESLRQHPGWRLLSERVKELQERELRYQVLDAPTLERLREHRGHILGMGETLQQVEIIQDDGTRIPGFWVQDLEKRSGR